MSEISEIPPIGTYIAIGQIPVETEDFLAMAEILIPTAKIELTGEIKWIE